MLSKTRGVIANAHIKIGSNSYEKVETFKYLGSLLTNQNSIQEEIKCRLKAGNSCYYSVQRLSSSRLLSKNLKIKIYKTIILPVVIYGCETWSDKMFGHSYHPPFWQFLERSLEDKSVWTE